MKRNILFLGVLIVLLASTLHTIHRVTATPEPDESAFYRLWERTDAPVMKNTVDRTWYWGPAPMVTLNEGYVEGYEGQRRVQYWDKGRMEISNPNESPANPWYVTAGLLPLEMISGQVQVGDQQFDVIGASQVPIAGDPNPDNMYAPTYASFASVTTVPAHYQITGAGLSVYGTAPRYGDLVDETLDVYGNVGTRPDLATMHPGTRLVYYDSILGHNIPVVFWDFLQRVGKVQINGEERTDLLVDWQYVMGHPASEPYWVRTKVKHVEQDILVQVYERRVLTYNPNNPPGWEVEMGNVGQHYYKWRYGMAEPVNRSMDDGQTPPTGPDTSNWRNDPYRELNSQDMGGGY
jgi:hypothetical protein